jgi:hypothetical protein
MQTEAGHVEAVLAPLTSEAMSPCPGHRLVDCPLSDGRAASCRCARAPAPPPELDAIFNVGINEDAGVDLVGNVLDAAFRTRLQDSTQGSSWEPALLTDGRRLIDLR